MNKDGWMGPPCYKHDHSYGNTERVLYVLGGGEEKEIVEKYTVQQQVEKHYLRSLTRLFPSPPSTTNHFLKEEEVTN